MESISRYLEKKLKVRVNRDKLDAFKRQAILTRFSRKCYWHLAKTFSMNVGLSNAYLKREGLTSIRTLWIKIYYPATA